MSNDNWVEAKSKVSTQETKECAACRMIFLPKWHTAKRCDFCRKNKIPYIGEEINGKPF